MKRLPIVFAGLFLAIGAAPESAAAVSKCDIGSITASPDFTSHTVIFDDFAALGDSQATCKVVVPLGQGLPDDVVVVYSADYRGAIAGGSVGRIFIKHDGRLFEVVLDTTDIDPFDEEEIDFRTFVGSRDDELITRIRLALSEFDDPFAYLMLDSIDYNELARATIGDLQDSVDALSAARTALVTHLNATFDLLGGAGHELEGPDRFGALVGVGSITMGGNGQMSLGDGFSILGGAGFTDQAAGGAQATGLLATGAVRYVTPGNDLLRPFAEGGLKAGGLGLRFTRDYETNQGTTTATGSGSGLFLGGYLRGGVLVAPDPANTIVLSATYARDWLSIHDYDEVLDGTNLFAASLPGQTSTFDTVKVGADWTTRLTDEMKLTLSGAVGHTFAQDDLAARIAFAGAFSGAGVSEGFMQYGARLDYEIAETTSVGLFVHGATGAVSGTHAQIGGTFNVRF